MFVKNLWFACFAKNYTYTILGMTMFREYVLYINLNLVNLALTINCCKQTIQNPPDQIYMSF